MSIIVFKSLDQNKTGKIKVADFVTVIESYREDFQLNDIQNNKLNEKDNKASLKLLNDILYIRKKLDDNVITVEDIYAKAGSFTLDNAKLYELYSSIKNLFKNDIKIESVENLLNFLKHDDNKIYKKDMHKFLHSNDNEININFISDYKRYKDKTNKSKIHLNDTKLFWIKKLILLLEEVNVTGLMAFNASTERDKNSINLDNFKKKLKIIIPNNKITAGDLNSIADSFDINKTKEISLEEYNDIIEITKAQMEGNKPNIDNNFNNILLKSLPVKGNLQILNQIKSNFDKSLVVDLNNKKLNNTVKESNKNGIPLKFKELKEEYAQNSAPLQENNLSVKDFLKDLEVFDQGEWNLIEILEEIQINYFLPSYSLYNLLIKTYSPTITKNKIACLIKEIDSNSDGYINYNDLIEMLLTQLNHRSTKLALKEIARKIEYDEILNTDDYFKEKNLDLNLQFNFVQFSQFFIKTFEIAPPVIKKLFEEIKEIKKRNIFVYDIIDFINEYRTDSFNHKKKLAYEGINILDKKYFEDQMKNLMNNIQKIFGNNKNLDDNLTKFLNLPGLINFKIFREKFVKPLQIEMSLGISIFKILKSFSLQKENQEILITKDDIFNLINSYINNTSNPLDVSLIVKSLEHNGPELKYCFDSMKFNNTVIPVADIYNMLKQFYKNYPKESLLEIIKNIDTKRIGYLNLKDIIIFIFKYSKGKVNNIFT